jgi:uncharacterized membrane protein HdeD (DUF308 family)
MTSPRTPSATFSLVDRPLLRALADKWWLLLLRGIAAIVFGILAFMWPLTTLVVLTLLWGFYALADGVLALWAAIVGKGGEAAPRWWLAVVGIVGILAGVLAFARPDAIALALLLVIAIWALVIGMLQVWGAILLRKEIEGEWLLILSGLLSIAFGVILLTRPAAGALAVVWIIAWYGLLAGFTYIALALRLKTYKS